MGNSSLITETRLAHVNNYAKGRTAKISEITVHHAASTSFDSIGDGFQVSTRKASSHYGVGGKRIALYVDEANTAWTNSNSAANARAVTIETTNSKGEPNWEVSDETYGTLIKLCADIAKRNDLAPLKYGTTLRMHQEYSATACPGPYLKAKITSGQFAKDVNTILSGGTGMENLVLWYGENDARAAGYLMGKLACPGMPLEQWDSGQYPAKRFFVVGGSEVPGAVMLSGANKYKTAEAVLDWIAKN